MNFIVLNHNYIICKINWCISLEISHPCIILHSEIRLLIGQQDGRKLWVGQCSGGNDLTISCVVYHTIWLLPW